MSGNYEQATETYGQKYKALGICHIVTGGISIVMGIASVAMWMSNNILINNAPGIWVGIWTVILGGLSIGAYRGGSTRCNLIGGLVLGYILLALSLYMVYFEYTAILLAQVNRRLLNPNPLATHAITMAMGIIIFIADIVFLVFAHKGRSLAFSS